MKRLLKILGLIVGAVVRAARRRCRCGQPVVRPERLQGRDHGRRAERDGPAAHARRRSRARAVPDDSHCRRQRHALATRRDSATSRWHASAAPSCASPCCRCSRSASRSARPGSKGSSSISRATAAAPTTGRTWAAAARRKPMPRPTGGGAARPPISTSASAPSRSRTRASFGTTPRRAAAGSSRTSA